MRTRIISGIIGSSLVVALLILNQSVPILLNIIVAAVCIAAIYEVFTAMGIYKMYTIIAPSLIFGAVLPMIGEGVGWHVSWYVYTVVIFCIMIFMNKVLSFKDIAVIYSMSMLITLSLGKIVSLRDYGVDNGNTGIFYVVLSLALPWMADTGAYFFGSFFGKHKLCPDISPKKTIEGAIGGTVVCVFSMILVCFIFQKWVFPPEVTIHYWNMILLALIGSVLSILGDLCFSLVKRGCHIKDFGNAIPGHGGILDRFDSVVFVAPFIYYYVQYLPLLAV